MRFFMVVKEGMCTFFAMLFLLEVYSIYKHHLEYFLLHNDKYILQNAIKKSKDAQEDEWVTQTKNKIYAEVYNLVIAICGISIVVKFLLNAYTADLHLRNDTEILILLIASLYYLHRSIRLGVFAAEEEMK